MSKIDVQKLQAEFPGFTKLAKQIYAQNQVNTEERWVNDWMVQVDSVLNMPGRTPAEKAGIKDTMKLVDAVVEGSNEKSMQAYAEALHKFAPNEAFARFVTMTMKVMKKKFMEEILRI